MDHTALFIEVNKKYKAPKNTKTHIEFLDHLATIAAARASRWCTVVAAPVPDRAW
jgi:hypothetical protein